MNHNSDEFTFKTKLIMLLGEIMKVMNDKERVALASCGRDERNRRIASCQYIDSIRNGRNFQGSHGPVELSTYMSRDEFVRKSKNVVQEESPDVAYSPFEHAFQLDAYNRFTICRKLLMLAKAQIIVGGKMATKKLGSVIDYKFEVPLLEPELIDVTMILHSQYQVKITMETLNVLCGATKAPSALMKIHALMIAESRREETNEETKVLSDIFAAIFTGDRQNSPDRCVLCTPEIIELDTPNCECGLRVISPGRLWSNELRKLLNTNVLWSSDSTLLNATEPTDVVLSCSLGILAMLASKVTMDNLEKDREIVTLAVENFRGTVRGKDNAIPMLRKNIGYAVSEADKTYRFEGCDHDMNLMQLDEVKSVFPAHLVLLDSSSGQILVDQTFHMPILVDINYMSIPAFRRYRRTVRRYRTAATRDLWSKAAGKALTSFTTGNRTRKATKEGEEQEVNDSQLTKEAQIFEPLVVAPADRSSDCVNRFHKNQPCYCCCEAVSYSKDNLMLIVWDLEDLEGIGLPHRDSNHVIFCLKNYLPVRWIAANPQAYAELEAPTEDSLQRVDV